MISALSKGVPRVLKARAQLPINAIRANGTVPTPRKEVPFHDTWKSDDPERMAAAEARDKEIRADHLKLNTAFPANSQAPGRDADPLEVRRKRLIYRSKQRGWLEVDLLMGTWAVEHVPKLSEEELDQYEAILNQETLDIYNCVTGKEDPPKEIRSPLLDQLRAWAAASPLGATPQGYADAKSRANMT